MTGDLYKKIILFLLVINVYVYSNTLDRQNYIFSDFIPIQESKTSIGFKLFQSIDSEIDMKIEKSLLLTNWFTNNLYMTIIGVFSTFLVVYFSAKYSREYFQNS